LSIFLQNYERRYRVNQVYYKNRADNRSLLSEILPLKLPLSLNIEPTNLCNFRCVHCVQSFSDYENFAGYKGNMDMDL